MRARPSAYLSLALIGPAAVALAVASISYLVYHAVSANMVEMTQEVLHSRLQGADQAVLDVFYQAARRANDLLVDEPGSGSGTPADRRNLDQLVADTPGGLRAWIAYPDGTIRFGPMADAAYIRRTGWWSAYATVDMQKEMTLFSAEDSAAVIGAPFRDELDLDTIVPILVYRLDGVRLVSTAIVEIDLTQVLGLYEHDLSVAVGGASSTADLSIFLGDGTLVESTRNIPVMQVHPLLDATKLRLSAAEVRSLTAGGQLSLVGRSSIELVARDERTGLIFESRVPRVLVRAGVAAITLQILAIGIVSLAGVLALGVLLVRAIRRMKSAEERQLSARLEMLQAKMNPHFLFNTLDSMVGVAARNDRQTLIRMLRSLSYMLHLSVRKQEDVITLEEELEYVRSYVQLQRVRYAERFSFKITVDEKLLDGWVYRFSIQPLVENCFVHGVAELPERRVGITVRIEPHDDGLSVTVADNGPGCPADIAQRLARQFRDGSGAETGHFGLAAVHGRLRALHGGRYGLDLQPAARGFAIRELLPRLKGPAAALRSGRRGLVVRR